MFDRMDFFNDDFPLGMDYEQSINTEPSILEEIYFPEKGFSSGRSSLPARRSQNIGFAEPDQTLMANLTSIFNSSGASSQKVAREQDCIFLKPKLEKRSPIIVEPLSRPMSPVPPFILEPTQNCFSASNRDERSCSELEIFKTDFPYKGWQSFQLIPPPDQLRKNKQKQQKNWTKSLGRDVEDHVRHAKRKHAALFHSPKELGGVMNNFFPAYAEAHRNEEFSSYPIENLLKRRKRISDDSPTNPFIGTINETMLESFDHD